MVTVPRVRSFCGCCDLKTACIVIAALKIIGCITAILVYLIGFFIVDEVLKDKEKDDEDVHDAKKLKIVEIIVYICLIVAFVIAVVTILYSYWFIRGIVSVIGVDIVIKIQFLFPFF